MGLRQNSKNEIENKWIIVHLINKEKFGLKNYTFGGHITKKIHSPKKYLQQYMGVCIFRFFGMWKNIVCWDCPKTKSKLNINVKNSY